MIEEAEVHARRIPSVLSSFIFSLLQSIQMAISRTQTINLDSLRSIIRGRLKLSNKYSCMLSAYMFKWKLISWVRAISPLGEVYSECSNGPSTNIRVRRSETEPYTSTDRTVGEIRLKPLKHSPTVPKTTRKARKVNGMVNMYCV